MCLRRPADSFVAQLMTWSYLVPLNFRQLLVPWVLLADYSDNTVPLVTRWDDPRNAITVRVPAHLLACVLGRFVSFFS